MTSTVPCCSPFTKFSVSPRISCVRICLPRSFPKRNIVRIIHEPWLFLTRFVLVQRLGSLFSRLGESQCLVQNCHFHLNWQHRGSRTKYVTTMCSQLNELQLFGSHSNAVTFLSPCRPCCVYNPVGQWIIGYQGLNIDIDASFLFLNGRSVVGS